MGLRGKEPSTEYAQAGELAANGMGIEEAWSEVGCPGDPVLWSGGLARRAL